jgi:hypothetical protein
MTVLPHVGDAEVCEQPHVGGWEELRDHHKSDLAVISTCVATCRGDPLAHLAEAGCKFVSTIHR